MGIKEYNRLIGRFFKMRRNPTVWYVSSISKKRGSYVYDLIPMGMESRSWDVECGILYKQYMHPEGGWTEYEC